MVKFQIEGLEELDKAVRKLPQNVQKRVLKGALRAGGRVIVKSAKQKVRKKTGTLRKSIHLKTGKSRDGAKVFVATKPEAFYSHMVEFGTSKMQARPFLRPAFDETQEEVIKAIGAALAKGIIKETDKL
jgi:HK97 gp10 family phage protein